MKNLEQQVDHFLDLQGLMCPMPLLKAKQALNRMDPAQTLGVLATDPGSERDFQVFAQQSGHELLDCSVQGDVYAYTIRKKT
jgi:tRNA 2-thiouridine synthesizing protein A